MVLNKICSLHDCKAPLTFMDLLQPVPVPGELLIKVNACGVCHTKLDEIEGCTPPPSLPVIPGHQAVGRVTGIESQSVANVTRADVSEFISLASEMNIQPEVQEYSLDETNRALVELKDGKSQGAKVLMIN